MRRVCDWGVHIVYVVFAWLFVCGLLGCVFGMHVVMLVALLVVVLCVFMF